MKHIVIATHGELADGLVSAARVICGEEATKEIKTFMIRSETNIEEIDQEIQEYLSLDRDGEYFVMTDLYGASPCISMVKALRDREYRLVTGVNLGMILEVLVNKNKPLAELEEKAIHAGKEGVGTFYIKA